MRLILAALVAISLGADALGAQNPLVRRYGLGDSVGYHMEAINAQRQASVAYSADVVGIVRRDSAGAFIESLRWTTLSRNGAASAPPDSGRAAQTISLDRGWQPVPDVRRLDPRLIGPALDLFTFYIDAKLAAAQEGLRRQGDHVYLPLGIGGSWADGTRVLIGKDAVDFDISMLAIHEKEKTAEVLVRHVPPQRLSLQLPASWMSSGATPNWVEIESTPNGRFRGRAGVESFDVTLTLSLVDGRLLSAIMENPVQVMERECADRALVDCGPATRYRIHRRIAVTASR